MAIYEGARPNPLFPGRVGRLGHVGRREAAEAPPRRRLRGAVRAKRGSNRAGFLLGGIVLAFLLAFFSLAQTVRVSATSYDIDRLATERELLEAERRDVTSDLNRLGREPAIRKLAIDAGLGQLPEPLVIPAR